MTLFQAFGQFAAAGPVGPTYDAELIVPTSVTSGSGTVSVTADGLITYTTISDMQVNGVFSSTYVDYMYVVEGTSSGNNEALSVQARNNLTNVTSSTYNRRYYDHNGSNTVSAEQLSQVNGRMAALDDGLRSFTIGHIYRPALAVDTIIRNDSASMHNDAYYVTWNNSFTDGTAHDGLVLFSTGTSASGTLAIYGLRKEAA